MRLTMKKARRMADKTQEEVALELDVHVQTYRKWEQKPWDISIENGMKFSKIVKIPFDEIFFDAESNLIRQIE